MKAIVTGASGFIGSQVVNHLATAGYQVASIGRRKILDMPQSRQLILDRPAYIKATLDDPSTVLDRLAGLGFDDGNLVFFFHFAWGGESQLD